MNKIESNLVWIELTKVGHGAIASDEYDNVAP